MRRGLWLLLLVGLLSGTAAGSAEPLAVVRLPARVAVAGPDILLGDIADIETSDVDLNRRLQQLSLGRAAIPGQSRALSVATMRVRMRQQLLPEKQIVIDAPESAVSVTTRAQVVPGAALVEAAEQAMRPEGSESGPVDGPLPPGAEVILACAEPDTVTVGDGSLELHVSRLIGTAPGPMVASVDVIVGDAVQRTVMVRCDARVALDVLVTVAPLGRHASLGEETVAVERREFASLPRGLIEAADADVGRLGLDRLRTTRPLAAGTVLTDRMVELAPIIIRGQPVQIVATLGRVQVAAAGVALTDGRLGDIIQVENVVSGQNIRARVIASDRVEALVH